MVESVVKSPRLAASSEWAAVVAEDPIEGSAAPFAVPSIYIPGNSTEVRPMILIDEGLGL
jgi:hypothetical protein